MDAIAIVAPVNLLPLYSLLFLFLFCFRLLFYFCFYFKIIRRLLAVLRLQLVAQLESCAFLIGFTLQYYYGTCCRFAYPLTVILLLPSICVESLRATAHMSTALSPIASTTTWACCALFIAFSFNANTYIHTYTHFRWLQLVSFTSFSLSRHRYCFSNICSC